MAKSKTLVELGNLMLAEAGESAIINSYETNEPAAVGRIALAYGDINPDGTFN